MQRKCPTVAELRALKGRRQLTMLRIFTLEEAAAAEAAGIDIVSAPIDLVSHPRYREVAPGLFSMTGVDHREAGTREDYLRFAGRALMAGANALYCSGGLETVRFLAQEHIPVVGHVGLVPSRNTWTGGFRAVGKTPVHVKKDVAGFVGNRLQHALWREAIAIVAEGIADARTVDTVVKASFGRRLAVLGPIENADLVGTDLTLDIHNVVLKHLNRDADPSPYLKKLVEDGRLGMKSGEGFRSWTALEADQLRNDVYRYLKEFKLPA